MDATSAIAKLKQTTDGNEVKDLICEMVLSITSNSSAISEKQATIDEEHLEIKSIQVEILDKQEALAKKHDEFAKKQVAADLENKSILESIRLELLENQSESGKKQENEMIYQLKSERNEFITSIEMIKKENSELKKTLSAILQFIKKG